MYNPIVLLNELFPYGVIMGSRYSPETYVLAMEICSGSTGVYHLNDEVE